MSAQERTGNITDSVVNSASNIRKRGKARAQTKFLKYVELRGPRLTADERTPVLALLDRCR